MVEFVSLLAPTLGRSLSYEVFNCKNVLFRKPTHLSGNRCGVN
jgi:hypothetical protein